MRDPDGQKEERKEGREGRKQCGWRTEGGQGPLHRPAAANFMQRASVNLLRVGGILRGNGVAHGTSRNPEGAELCHRVITSELHGGHEREHYWSEKEGDKGAGREREGAGGAKRAYQTTPVAEK